MIIFVDDIKISKPEIFYPYMSGFFGVLSVTDVDSLYDCLSEYDDKLEIILNDMQNIDDEDKPFVNKVVRCLHDVKFVKKDFTLTLT